MGEKPSEATLPPNKTRVAQLLENLSYGMGPEESTDIAKKWLQDHKEVFGYYVGGRFVEQPEGHPISFHECKDQKGNTLARIISAHNFLSSVVGQVASSAKLTEWRQSSILRSTCLDKIAGNLEKHQQLLTLVETLTSQTQISNIRDIVVPYVIRSFRYYAGWAMLKDDNEFKDLDPSGVVLVVVDDRTSPLFAICRKICPALAMGNSVIVVSTHGSLSAMLLADIFSMSGLPEDIYNVVPVEAADVLLQCNLNDCPPFKPVLCGSVDKSLVHHMFKVSSNASATSGHAISTIVLESADLHSAATSIVEVLCNPIEQVTRKVFVQENIFNKFWELLCERVGKIRVGSSLNKSVDITPTVEKSEHERIRTLLEESKKEGAEVFAASEAVDSDRCKSESYAPVVVVRNVQTASRIVVEEVQGPVAVVMPFRTVKEAITLTNNSCRRHTVSVWTEKLPVALEVAKSVKAGVVWVNTQNKYDPAAGFGGSQSSGCTRDGGKQSLYEYLQLKCDTSKDGDRSEKNKVEPEPLSSVTLKSDAKCIDMYIGGVRKRSENSLYRPVHDHEEKMIAYVPAGDVKDLEGAITAAQNAQSGWEKCGGQRRAQILYAIARNLKQKKEEFQTYLQKMGTGSEEAIAEINLSIEQCFHWAAYCVKYGGGIEETQLYGTVLGINEAVGTVGIICPDSCPLLSFVSLMAAAISRGNAVVMITSETNPIPALNMSQVFDASGVPKGVVSILTGKAQAFFNALAQHRRIDSLWCHRPELLQEFTASENAKHQELIFKRTWFVNGNRYQWMRNAGINEALLHHTTTVKSVWMPAGDIFAN